MGDETGLDGVNFRFIRISNKDRLPQSTSSSKFLVDLSNENQIHRVVDIRLQAVSVPNVFPNIYFENGGPSGNSRLIYETGTLGAPAGVSVQEGFYNIDQLLDNLKNVIEPDMAPGGTLEFTVDPITCLVSWLATGDTVKFYTIDEDPLSTLSPFIGNTSPVAIGNTGQFASMPSLEGEQMVFLHSKTLNASKTRLSNGQGVSAFASIPVRVDYKKVIYYETAGADTDRLSLSRQTDLATVDITLRAQDGRVLKLNDNNELIIVLKVFYEP